LLLSNLVAIAQSVAEARAGISFEPTVMGLKSAITQLQQDYAAYQANTQPYIAANFSPVTHLQRYQQLYRGVT
jgi:hypothetical protein